MRAPDRRKSRLRVTLALDAEDTACMNNQVPRIPTYSYSHIFWWDKYVANKARRAFYETIHNSRSCPYCRLNMRLVPELSAKFMPTDYVIICDICGYWFGRGYKDDEGIAADLRGATGLISYKSLDSPDIDTSLLIEVLNENPDWSKYINPFKAEELVCDILSHTFGWEVKHFGGRKDGNIDAIAIRSNKGKSIIQVKWHKDHKKAESVKVVRELAGTLVAKGVPNGIIVTTRRDLSPQAKTEASDISGKYIVGVGKLDIDWIAYSDILSMLEIASTKITATKKVPFSYDSETVFIFDRGGVWGPRRQYITGSFDITDVSEVIDPYALFAQGGI